MACFFCQINNCRQCGPSCGLCGVNCPGHEGLPNGMKESDYPEDTL